MRDAALVAAWPLFGLRLTHEDLELRYPDDHDLVAVAAVATRDMLGPDEWHFMPNLGRAVTGDPDEAVRNVLTHHWGLRAATSPQACDLPLVTVLAGRVVGMQGLHTRDFAVLREVHTGSFLAPGARRRGVGTRMRAMALELAFGHLGALAATSAYAVANAASRTVSGRLGYEPDGRDVHVWDGGRYDVQRVRLERGRWQRTRPAWLDGVRVEGAAGALDALGLAEAAG